MPTAALFTLAATLPFLCLAAALTTRTVLTTHTTRARTMAAAVTPTCGLTVVPPVTHRAPRPGRHRTRTLPHGFRVPAPHIRCTHPGHTRAARTGTPS